MSKLTIFATICITMLSGCTALNTGRHSEFACMDENCPTPIEVYSDTHGVSFPVAMGRTPEEWKTGGRQEKGKDKEEKELRKALSSKALDLVSISYDETQLASGSHKYVRPIRENSQVMRVWVAPWIDDDDNLNWSTYFFTEVTKKKWNYGEHQVRQFGLPGGFGGVPR